MAEAGVPGQPWGNRSLDSSTGQKVVAGFRPLRIVGMEVQLVDFGSQEVAAYAGGLIGSGQTTHCCQQSSYMSASSEGKVLAALLFFPEPLVSFDVYTKVGVAHLDESLDAYAFDELTPGCQFGPGGFPPFCLFRNEVDQSESSPYVGFGFRYKIAPAAGVRVEYEAIDGDLGDNTTMFSLGIAWEH